MSENLKEAMRWLKHEKEDAEECIKYAGLILIVGYE